MPRLGSRTMELVKLMAADVARESVDASNSRVQSAMDIEFMAMSRLGAWAALAAREVVATAAGAANAMAAKADFVVTEDESAAMNAMLVRMEEKAEANATEAERLAAARRQVSVASRPYSVESEHIRLLVSEMDNKELVRFAQLGLNEGTLEEMLTQRAADICAFCQEDVTTDDVTIILPCCGKRPHKECFVKWSSRSGRCMYCSTMCDTSRRGFDTHASFTRWLIRRDRMYRMISSTDHASAIGVLIKSLTGDGSDVEKSHAAMQLLDLLIGGKIGKCMTYGHYMMKMDVEYSLLNVILGDCGNEAKEAAGFLFLRLVDMGIISSTVMMDPVIFASVRVYRGQLSILVLCPTFSDRERERELYRDRINKRIVKLLDAPFIVASPRKKALLLLRREVDRHTDALIYSLMLAQQRDQFYTDAYRAALSLVTAATAATAATLHLYIWYRDLFGA